jgi:hypothetical protein
MIYKDKYAHKDTPHLPAIRGKDRGEVCLNCAYYFDEHNGWACGEWDEFDGEMVFPNSTDFHDLCDNKRYLTQSMKDSIQAPVRVALTIKKNELREIDIGDWRTWAHNVSGECSCGIKRSQCDYHKE